MKYSRLGNSSIHISRIGFGCMSLSKDSIENQVLLQSALDKGINYFDTADIYDHGNNEILLGKAFREKRKEVIIASKVGNVWKNDGSGLDWNPSKEHILSSIDKSLQRLHTDYIDLYQLHGGTIGDPIDDIIEAFELLKTQGKIRCYGISSIRPNVIREYVKRSQISGVMMQYSLLDRRPEESCLPLLLQNNISGLARGSVAQGLLINKPAKSYLSHTLTAVQKARESVLAISNEACSPAQICLQFVLQQPAVASAVLGMSRPEQLNEAVQAIASPPLNQEALELLGNAIPPIFYEQHR